MAFRYAADSGVAAHLAYGIAVDGDQRGARADLSGDIRCFTPGVPPADNYDIECSARLHLTLRTS
jgi:hypothetical protein